MTQRASNQENSLPTSNDQTLSERLRDCVKVTFSAGLHGVESDCRQAAEELDRQRAEIERLTRELDRWQSPSNLAAWNELLDLGEPAHGNKPLQVAAAVALMKAERDRLRAALEGVIYAPSEEKARLAAYLRARAIVEGVPLSGEPASAHETRADVRQMNKQMCESEGHVFSRIATHRCFRCGTEVLPGAYLEHVNAQNGSGERHG